RTEPRGDPVGASDVGIAENLEVLMVVCGEKSYCEKRLSMMAKVRRNIANPQSAVERAVVGMGLDEPCQRVGVLSAPAAVFFKDRLSIVAGAENQGVEQVAVRHAIIRLQFQRPAVAGDRFVQLP